MLLLLPDRTDISENGGSKALNDYCKTFFMFWPMIYLFSVIHNIFYETNIDSSFLKVLGNLWLVLPVLNIISVNNLWPGFFSNYQHYIEYHNKITVFLGKIEISKQLTDINMNILPKVSSLKLHTWINWRQTREDLI